MLRVIFTVEPLLQFMGLKKKKMLNKKVTPDMFTTHVYNLPVVAVKAPL